MTIFAVRHIRDDNSRRAAQVMPPRWGGRAHKVAFKVSRWAEDRATTATIHSNSWHALNRFDGNEAVHRELSPCQLHQLDLDRTLLSGRLSAKSYDYPHVRPLGIDFSVSSPRWQFIYFGYSAVALSDGIIHHVIFNLIPRYILRLPRLRDSYNVSEVGSLPTAANVFVIQIAHVETPLVCWWSNI